MKDMNMNNQDNTMDNAMNNQYNNMDNILYRDWEYVQSMSLADLKEWAKRLEWTVAYWNEEGRYDPCDWDERSEEADCAEDVLGLIRKRLKEIEEDEEELKSLKGGINETERIKDIIEEEEL